MLATKFHGAMGETPTARQLPALDHARGRGLAATPENRLDRPLPGAPPRARHRHRGDARRASDLVHQGKVRYIGSSTFPPSQIVEAQWAARERRLRALRLRAAALLDARARGGGRRAADRAAPRDGRDPLEPARRRLAVGPMAQGREELPTSTARAAAAGRAMTSRSRPTSASSTQPRRSAQLAEEAGISLIHMALAFVIRHPRSRRRSSGRARCEQLESQLGATEVELVRRAARPDRRDRRAGHQLQPGRRRLAEPRARG